MMSRTDNTKKPAAGRGFTLTDASIALCGIALMGAALVSRPLEVIDAVVTFVTPAAHAAEAGQAPQALTRAPAWGERTVYFPESFPPVPGEVATPIEQF